MLKHALITILAVIFIITLWILSALWINAHLTPETRGTVGDMFGPVNALFAGLAFAAIVYTIILQQKELGLQRKELINTRNIFQKQQFENTFFQLTAGLQLLIDGITYEHTIIEYTNGKEKDRRKTMLNGRAYFEFIQNDFEKLFEFISKTIKNGSINQAELTAAIERMMFVYKIDKNFFYSNSEEYKKYDLSDPSALTKYLCFKVFPSISAKVSHYFRNLANILSYIKENEKMQGETLQETDGSINGVLNFKQYADFLRAQLSDAELFLLFYRSLDDQKLKRLFDHFHFIDDLPTDLLLNNQKKQQIN